MEKGTDMSLPEFLLLTKDKLRDLESVDVIHAVIGNEACDLDSAVSAIALAFFLFKKNPDSSTLYLPILNIQSADYRLRTEVKFALQLQKVSQELLTFRDDIDLYGLLNVEKTLKLTLVDFNVFRGKDSVLDSAVIQVLDHHKNEREESSLTVTIEPVGSCCSLVTEAIFSELDISLPEDVLWLLYGTILLDTVCLAAGKATPKDVISIEKLETILPKPNRQAIFDKLLEAKLDVLDLKTKEIMNKDMKMIATDGITLAFSSVPLHLQDLFSRTESVQDIADFSKDQGADGVILMGFCKDDQYQLQKQLSIYSRKEDILDKIARGLCHNAHLSLQPESLGNTSPFFRTFTQGNITASRKFVLPLVQDLLKEISVCSDVTNDTSVCVMESANSDVTNDTSVCVMESAGSDVTSDLPTGKICLEVTNEEINIGNMSNNNTGPANQMLDGHKGRSNISTQDDDISTHGDGISNYGDGISNQDDDISTQDDDISTQDDDINTRGDVINTRGDVINTHGDGIMDLLDVFDGHNAVLLDTSPIHTNTATPVSGRSSRSDSPTPPGEDFPQTTTPLNTPIEYEMNSHAEMQNRQDLPSFNNTEMVNKIHNKKSFLTDGGKGEGEEGNKYPFTPVNSFSDPYMMEQFAKERDLQQKILRTTLINKYEHFQENEEFEGGDSPDFKLPVDGNGCDVDADFLSDLPNDRESSTVIQAEDEIEAAAKFTQLVLKEAKREYLRQIASSNAEKCDISSGDVGDEMPVDKTDVEESETASLDETVTELKHDQSTNDGNCDIHCEDIFHNADKVALMMDDVLILGSAPGESKTEDTEDDNNIISLNENVDVSKNIIGEFLVLGDDHGETSTEIEIEAQIVDSQENAVVDIDISSDGIIKLGMEPGESSTEVTTFMDYMNSQGMEEMSPEDITPSADKLCHDTLGGSTDILGFGEETAPNVNTASVKPLSKSSDTKKMRDTDLTEFQRSHLEGVKRALDINLDSSSDEEADTRTSHKVTSSKLSDLNNTTSSNTAGRPTTLSSGTKKKIVPNVDLFNGNDVDTINSPSYSSDEDIGISIDDEKTPDDLTTPDVLNSSMFEGELDWGSTVSSTPVEPIPEYSAREEFEDERHWKSVQIGEKWYKIDMKVIEPYKKVLSHGGYYGDGFNAIIVFTACYLPDRRRRDYHYVMDNLFLYVISTLELLVAEDYVIVYFHGSTPRHKIPSLRWLKRCYDMIDRRLKKNLKGLLVVHPTIWLKTLVFMTKPFISSKFSSKLRYIKNLEVLSKAIPTEYIYVPDEVKKYDELCSSKPAPVTT